MRIVVGERGQVDFHSELILRFGYGATVPWVTRMDDRTLRAIAGPDMVVLRTPAPMHGENFKTVGDFTVKAGETVPFVLSYAPSHEALPEPVDVDASAAQRPEAFWSDWAAQNQIDWPVERGGGAARSSRSRR